MNFTRQLRTAVSKVPANNPYISVLLKEIKDVTDAENELRWMREFVDSSNKTQNESQKSVVQPPSSSKTSEQHNRREQLMKLCERRARGEPLQYILGSQPFGDLDIKCKPGALIPRPETEAYTTYLASKICNGLLDKQFKTLIERAENRAASKESSIVPEIKILDACSGSGCISLLLHNLLFENCKGVGKVRIDGVDISKVALDLSRENLEQNINSGVLNPLASSDVQFRNYDIYSGPWNAARKELKPYHIIVSNPPYISREEYETMIPRSVREWEPEGALVPKKLIDEYPGKYHLADRFYYALMAHYHTSMQSAFMMVMEIGDEGQAKRVLEMAMKEFHSHESNELSVWRDSPDVRPSGNDLEIDKMSVPTEGQGNVRAVVLVRHMDQIQWIDDERHKSTRASSRNPR